MARVPIRRKYIRGESMIVRKLNGSERYDANLISVFCFHERISDPEARRAEIEKQTVEDWGAFDEDGTLMARVINHRFEFYIDGTKVKAGGIGAVSTLPEYRESGAIKQIFQKLLKEAYENGEVISTLFPFNHAFYRKQGYEVVTFQNNYELNPGLLGDYKFSGKVIRWNPGESVEEYLEIYNTFIKAFNFSMPRTAQQMAEHMKVDRLYQDRKFSYLLKEDGENVAYLTFTDIRNNPAAILHVEECAWINAKGFRAILAFLGRFTADYGMIQLPLPFGIDLLRILRSPRAYEIHKTSRFDFMVRAINVPKLLEVMKKPKDCDFVIRVYDESIEENNGVWRVTNDSVESYQGTEQPDIAVNQRELACLATGCLSVTEAKLLPGVVVANKEEMLSRVFREKMIFVGEHF